jgi:hypothetical protein
MHPGLNEETSFFETRPRGNKGSPEFGRGKVAHLPESHSTCGPPQNSGHPELVRFLRTGPEEGTVSASDRNDVRDKGTKGASEVST